MQKYLEALRKIVNITEGKCFLVHGTLLGCVREKGFIEGDEDLDIGILAEDWTEEFLDKIEKEFADISVGYWEEHKLIDKGKIGSISKIKIHKPNTCIDIWTKGIDGDRYFHSIGGKFSMKIPDKFLHSFKTIDFLGVKVRIPKMAEEYLSWNYGDDWKTPNPDWNFTDSPCLVRNKEAVIMAAGKIDKKWNNHLGIPKHLIEIGGEVLIRRTIHQLQKRGYNVAITLPERNYLGDLGIREIICTTEGDAIEKILNLKDEVPCLAIWGDVRFTEEAMDTITGCNKGLMFFGRESVGIIKRCGEPFAAILDPYSIRKAEDLKRKRLHSIHGGRRRCGEWELYRYINDIPLQEHRIKNLWTEINDLTDDIDTPANYVAFQQHIEKSLSHIVISRMWYEKEESLIKRIKFYESNLLPVLLNQTDKDFDIGILCNKKHEKIVGAIHPRIIPFFTKNKGGKAGKCWHIFSNWEDIEGLEKYDIQTNIDSDDTVSEDLIRTIRNLITDEVKTHIHFIPLLRDYYTGEIKRSKINYRDEYNSALYSLYQSKKEEYTYIGQDSHTRFYKHADKVITVPEGHYWVNIHKDNDSSTMASLKATELLGPRK